MSVEHFALHHNITEWNEQPNKQNSVRTNYIWQLIPLNIYFAIGISTYTLVRFRISLILLIQINRRNVRWCELLRNLHFVWCSQHFISIFLSHVYVWCSIHLKFDVIQKIASSAKLRMSMRNRHIFMTNVHNKTTTTTKNEIIRPINLLTAISLLVLWWMI